MYNVNSRAGEESEAHVFHPAPCSKLGHQGRTCRGGGTNVLHQHSLLSAPSSVLQVSVFLEHFLLDLFLSI